MEISKKSTLAKLLAAENITLEHRKVPTAYFDLKERKVVLPMWKNMDADLYDMLIGHEVSHALNTPLEGWHDNVIEYGPAIKSFLNVVEDARIERLIKEKFPGLVKNFYAGYRKLFNDDFFGVKDRDLSTLPLIDRINLHFKIGSMLGINFTDEEQVYVDRVANCQTWDEVVEVAHDLFGNAKEEMENQEEQPDSGSADDFEDDEFEDDYESDPSSGQSDDETEEEETDEEGNASGESSEQEEESPEESEGSSDSVIQQGPTDSSEPVAETDMNFRQSEESLLQENAKDIAYLEWNKLNPKHWVVPVSKTWDYNFEGIFKANRWSEDLPVGPIADECLTNFKQKNTATINQLVMQFEMKRKAKSLSRARENKTGELNMKKLWATQLTENVFLSNTVVPKGKNHGMVMFVDFSGSMTADIAATLEQTLIMVAFCKKVNIAFDVYLFNNSRNEYRNADQMEIANGGYTPGKMVIKDEGFSLIQMINSNMTSRAYGDAFKKCLVLAEAYRCYVESRSNRYSNSKEVSCWDLPARFQTGGTPLVETVMVARELVKKFKVDNRIEVMNTIFLTDGEPTGQYEIVGKSTLWSGCDRIAITEGPIVTVEKYNRRDRYIASIQYRSALKHFKATVDSRLINFHIGKFRKHELSMMYFETSDFDYTKFEEKYKKEFLKNKFFELENYNYFDTSYYIKNGKDLEVEDQVMVVESEKKADILKGFRNFQKGKASSRVFLNRLMDKVA